VERPPVRTGPGARAVDLLLLGYDDAVGALGTVEAGMVAVAHIRGDARRVDVLSVPHAMVVPVPGHGPRAIAAALALGGVPLVVRCTEDLLGIRMDHVVVLPLTGLAALTDALGGVTVQNEVPFEADGVTFPAGEQRLDGMRAAAFLRAAGTGGADRIDREHAYLRGLIELLLGGGPALPAGTVRAVASAVLPRLTTDPALDTPAVMRLALALRRLRDSDVRLGRVPGPAGLEALRRAVRDDLLGETEP
jgi:LCP family protein required for cell wall assembly